LVYLEILFGFALLVAGGDALVRGSVVLARRLGVSAFLIGLTLVGFGTSTPELVTSLQAALIDAPGIAVGNVVGSNIANILLILGLAALIAPLSVAREAFLRDGAMLVIASLACLAVVLAGMLARWVGVGMVALLAAYIVFSYLRDRRSHDAAAAMHEAEAAAAGRGPRHVWLAALLAAAGLGLTILGAHLLVGGAVALATAAGVSETLVGLTIVAVGTSLPELVTSVVAAARRQADVALGNIVGSNIFNILGILGITAAVRPIPVPVEIAALDVWVMLAATGALAAFAWSGWRISRLEGGCLLAGYLAYVAYLATTV